MHRIASLAKRWLLGTHQGAVDASHLPSYLNEFVFRFNRRRSRSRGMLFYRVLELAVAHDPVRYQDLARTKSPHQAAQAAGETRASSEPAALSAEPAVEVAQLRVNGYPKDYLCVRFVIAIILS